MVKIGVLGLIKVFSQFKVVGYRRVWEQREIFFVLDFNRYPFYLGVDAAYATAIV